MIGLTILLPAVLLGLATVLFTAREEHSLIAEQAGRRGAASLDRCPDGDSGALR